MTTEREIISHVARNGRYYGENFYGVHWNGRFIHAPEPRGLVVAIAELEGIPGVR